jgi:hypothetical protein
MCKAALLLSLALATPLIAQPAKPATGRVSGIVVLGDIPLPGATVTIQFGSEAYTIVTAADGRFVYDHVPLGAVVKIYSDMEGLKSQKRTVALTAAAASRDFTFAMKLAKDGPITIACPGPSPVEEPNTYRFLQTDIDKLPIGRSIDAVLDLLPGTH